MPHCSICTTFSISSLLRSSFPHQPNLRALKSSAATGCEFCALIWACLTAACTEQVIGQRLEAVDDSAIVISGNLRGFDPPVGGKQKAGFNELWLVCGDESASPGCSGQLELFTRRGMYLVAEGWFVGLVGC